jgi:K+-transporting ATPase c subunit
MEGKKISRKKGEVKIIGSKSLDYTFLDNDFLNHKYTNISHKNDEDNSNNVAPKDSKINKDIQRINKTDFEIAKSRYKGRITGGQSRQSHSSVYE